MTSIMSRNSNPASIDAMEVETDEQTFMKAPKLLKKVTSDVRVVVDDNPAEELEEEEQKEQEPKAPEPKQPKEQAPQPKKQEQPASASTSTTETPKKEAPKEEAPKKKAPKKAPVVAATAATAVAVTTEAATTETPVETPTTPATTTSTTTPEAPTEEKKKRRRFLRLPKVRLFKKKKAPEAEVVEDEDAEEEPAPPTFEELALEAFGRLELRMETLESKVEKLPLLEAQVDAMREVVEQDNDRVVGAVGKDMKIVESRLVSLKAHLNKMHSSVKLDKGIQRLLKDISDVNAVLSDPDAADAEFFDAVAAA